MNKELVDIEVGYPGDFKLIRSRGSMPVASIVDIRSDVNVLPVFCWGFGQNFISLDFAILNAGKFVSK
mgnify:CR=1 FL=1